MKVSIEDVFILESLLQCYFLKYEGISASNSLPAQANHQLSFCVSFLPFTTEVFLPITLKHCDRHHHKLTLNSTRKGKFH